MQVENLQPCMYYFLNMLQDWIIQLHPLSKKVLQCNVPYRFGNLGKCSPYGEVFIKHSSPPRRHCHAGGARPTFTEGNPLRWDLLSQGRGLFLKQMHPSTDRRLVSESAARA